MPSSINPFTPIREPLGYANRESVGSVGDCLGAGMGIASPGLTRMVKDRFSDMAGTAMGPAISAQFGASRSS